MAGAIAVGIDLGTTNSAAAWVDPSGRTAMLRNSEGDLITPSVVLFEDSEVIVGKEARRMASVYPDRVAQWVKRDMGSRVYSRPIRGEYLPPEVIQACILRKMKADVVAAVGPAAKAVLTVPAYFDEPRRKQTADAGEMAGLSLLDIVNEPTAAALGFGEVLGYLSPTGTLLGEMNVMVYDLGGGTFDATLLRLAPGDIRTLATDGDVQLGGYDWDTRLVGFAADAFGRAHGRDPREDPATLSRLYEAAVEAKHTLSARSHATIHVEHAGISFEVPVSREQFEEMTADLLERTAYTSRQLLAAAGLQWRDVSRILLVGGSTRMPMAANMLQRLTGVAPDRTVNPDEAVARGAAIYAHYLLSAPERGGTGATFQVTNVNSHSLGVEGIDSATFRKINVILIPRNTPLPAQVAERFATKTDAQRSIVIQVLEGESTLPGECTAIGRTVIRDLPVGLPKGWPVEVTFAYGANGRLSVRGVVPGTSREVTLELERDIGLSREGISRWKQAVDSAAGFDRFEAMVQEVLGGQMADGRGQRAESSGESAAGSGQLPGADQWDLGPRGPLPAAPAQPPPPPPAARLAHLGPAPDETAPSELPPNRILSQPTPLFAVGSGQRAEGREQRAEGSGQRAEGREGAAAPQPPTAVMFQPVEEPREGPAGVAKAAVWEPVQQPPSATRGAGRWVISVVAYVLSSAAGIAMAYFLISWLVPGARLPRLW
jgi:molecular chaperone DnaK